jgi:hypothetical protein
LAEMCKQTIIMGDRKRIGSLFCLPTNRARNRMAIRTEIWTRVDGPLAVLDVTSSAIHYNLKFAKLLMSISLGRFEIWQSLW